MKEYVHITSEKYFPGAAFKAAMHGLHFFIPQWTYKGKIPHLCSTVGLPIVYNIPCWKNGRTKISICSQVGASELLSI